MQEWNKQNQAFFEKQLGQLHAKILQVKADNIVNNERVLTLVGVNNPSLSSKTTIFALNKVIEMILQHLVTNSLLNNSHNPMPFQKQGLSGTFRPFQNKSKPDHDKSNQAENNSVDD